VEEQQQIEGAAPNSTAPLSIDFKAAKAIEGMPEGTVAKQIELYEGLYRDWQTGGYFHWWHRLVLRLARDPIRILRSMIRDLAVAHSHEVMNNRANLQQADSLGQFVKMVGDSREFRAFLYEHFYTELKRAEALNTPLLILAREIMLKQPAASRPTDQDRKQDFEQATDLHATEVWSCPVCGGLHTKGEGCQ
jgi:hypothetical protein